jgi:hypothetical protein
MRHMRPYLLALATALLLAAPAAAADAPKELRGSIAALSATSITVKDGSKSATCSVARTSPPLVEYRVGDRVAVVCKRTSDRWVLTSIKNLAPKPKPDETPLRQGGKLTDVSATSVTVRDGDHDFVCKLGDTSPPLDGYKVGDRVVIYCKGGVLIGIARVTVPTPDPPKTDPPKTDPPKPTTPTTPPVTERTGQGTLTSIRTDGITVHTDGGDVSCKLGADSPKLGDYHVGDKVKFGCRNDMLLAIYKVDAPPTTTPAPPVYKTGQGTLTSIRTDGLTVHTDGGDVNCRLGETSPKLGDFHVGDHVKFYCTNDVLSGIARI